MLSGPSVAAQSSGGVPDDRVPDTTTEPVAPEIRTSNVSVVDGTVTFELEVPPGIAGSRLDPSAVSVIIDGNYRRSEVVRPPADELVVMLTVDVSGSTADGPLDAAKLAANAFLDRLPDGTNVGLVSFGPEATLISAPTDDLDEITSGLDDLVADGSTALFDAVALGAEVLSRSGADTRVIVVFSDGGDTNSSVSRESARALAVAAGSRVDVVSLQTANSDPDALTFLAGSDGSVTAVDDPDTLESAFAVLGEGLGNQFLVTVPDVDASELTIVVRGDDGIARGLVTIDTASVGVTTPTGPAGQPAIVVPPAQIAKVVSVVATTPDTLFGDNTMTYGAGAVLAGLLLAGGLVAWPAPDARQRQKKQKPVLRRKRKPIDAAKRLTAMADAGLARTDRRSKTAQMLEQAGLALRPGEFVVLVAACVMASLTLGTVVFGARMGLVLAVCVVAGSRFWLKRKVTTMRNAFADQLGATLQLLASNLRVGHGLLQGIDSIARESEQPTSREFRRVVGEVRLGRDVGESLRAMADRLDNEDFRWVVQAIEIHREVGGDLGEVLDNVGVTIRDRAHLKGQIRALSADGRISAGVMMVLPFFVGGLMLFMSPGYLDELTGRTSGQLVLGVGALLMVLGGAWLKSIIRLQF